MATTTNYGWTTPDNTALVKDGASAIRTLGSSVDTTVKALSPGTTAGDVDYYTSSTAKARLGIGTTGQVLTVAAGVPSWSTLAASGAWTQIATGSFSGAQTSVTGLSGKRLFITFNGVSATGTMGNMRFRFNGVTTFDFWVSQNVMQNWTSGGGNDYAFLNQSTSDAINYSGAFYVDFADNTSITKKPFYAPSFTSSGNFQSGYYYTTSAITSVQFYGNAGTWDAGTYTIWSQS
jgi:hypothetical protein